MQQKDGERKQILQDKIEKALNKDYQDMSLKQIAFAVTQLEKLQEIAQDFKVLER